MAYREICDVLKQKLGVDIVVVRILYLYQDTRHLGKQYPDHVRFPGSTFYTAYIDTDPRIGTHVCGSCGKVSCYDGSDKVVCNWCGASGTASSDEEKMEVSGGGF